MGAFSRRIISVVTALSLLIFAVPAFADQTCFAGGAGGSCDDQGEATQAAIQRVRDLYLAADSAYRQTHVLCFEAPPPPATEQLGAIYAWANHKTYGCRVNRRGYGDFLTTRWYPIAQQCKNMQPPPPSALTGGMYCYDGCEVLNVSPSRSAMTGSSCDNPYTCRPGYTKNSDGICMPDKKCPPDTDKIDGKCVPKPPCEKGQSRGADGVCREDDDPNNPNNPNGCDAGKIKGPDGTCIPDTNQPCPTGQTRGTDGVCKPDGNDPGKDDDHEASGGDNCNTPPSCSGDAIMCLQLRVSWRIDCNTRKQRSINGGACNSIPSCTGEKCDAVEMSSLIMQWRTTCAVEELASKDTNQGDGDQPGWTRVDGMDQEGGKGKGDHDDEILHGIDFDESKIDTGGWLNLGGTCPALGVAGGGRYSSAFVQHLANPDQFWCDFIRWVYWVNVTLAILWALISLTEG